MLIVTDTGKFKLVVKKNGLLFSDLTNAASKLTVDGMQSTSKYKRGNRKRRCRTSTTPYCPANNIIQLHLGSGAHCRKRAEHVLTGVNIFDRLREKMAIEVCNTCFEWTENRENVAFILFGLSFLSMKIHDLFFLQLFY